MDSGPTEAGGRQGRRRRDKAGWVNGFILRRSFWVPATVMCEAPCSWGGCQEDPPPPLVPVREGMKVPGRAGNLRAGWVMPSMGSLTWHPFLTVAPTARAVTAKVGPPVPQDGREGGGLAWSPRPPLLASHGQPREGLILSKKGPVALQQHRVFQAQQRSAGWGALGLGGGGAQQDPSGAQGYHEALRGFTPL